MIVKLCGVALIGLVATSVMKGLKNEMSGFISAVTGLILLGGSIAMLYPIISYMHEITKETGFSVYIETVIKALGIAVISESAADLCRDAGESAIASKTEFTAKIMIIYLALPVIKNLISLAFGVVEG